MRKIAILPGCGPAMNRAVFFGFFLIAGCLNAQESAQLALPAVTLSVGEKVVTAEVADEPAERATGLMFRKDLEPDRGMLFVMREPERAAFWMKNTTLPLSVAYINQSGTILEIHDLDPLNEKPVPSAFPNIAYALEMEQGWFAKNRVLAGDRVRGLPPLAAE
jgi:uncharacterized protein